MFSSIYIAPVYSGKATTDSAKQRGAFRLARGPFTTAVSTEVDICTTLHDKASIQTWQQAFILHKAIYAEIRSETLSGTSYIWCVQTGQKHFCAEGKHHTKKLNKL